MYKVREANVLDLGIVIVNWNTRDLLDRCLRTVFDSEGLWQGARAEHVLWRH